MVVLHVKRDQQSVFLVDAKLTDSVECTASNLVELHNSRLKVARICDEMQALSEHGVAIASNMVGLLAEQIAELGLEDEEAERCEPSGGFVANPDPTGRRCGKAPSTEMRCMLERTVADLRCRISPETVKANVCLNRAAIKECFDIARGAVSIVYPMDLPDYDPLRMELENSEDLSGTRAAKEVMEESEATLWFANKEMKPENALSVHLGKNEKSKVIVKLSTKKAGQPASESWLSPESEKKLMADNFKRMEEMRQLERDNNDSFLNSQWADNHKLKRKFQGLDDISWKP